jgi:4'-phosphopantetheinyl transferase
LNLSAHDVEVRLVRTGGQDEEWFARLLQQLTPEERERAARFHFVKDRLTFALGRALVRKNLPECASTPFECNEFGKPEFVHSPGMPRYRFNISHCAGLVAVGFAIERDIGVDVEFVERRGASMDIARSYFAPAEVAWMESLPEKSRRAAFFGLWTRKEAYIKARGIGLSALSERIDDRAATWQFWQQQPTDSHVLAVAAHREVGEELTLRVREIMIEALL